MEINIIGPVNQLGYGITCLNIIKALHLENKISFFPIGQPQLTNQEDADIISETIRNNSYPNFQSPCIRIWHQHDMSQFVGKGLKIGFPIFELDEFSDIEKHHLNSLDKIFVCSNWAKNVCINNLTVDASNIHVIPLGVDNDIFKPCKLNQRKTTVFFNCGKWEIRKGHDIISELFCSAFDDNDDVELWLMCDNPFLKEEQVRNWININSNHKLGHKIRFIKRTNTQKEVYNIMQNIDCGLFPARAEGWNLELLELLACGKHVITTNYAAHTEFCNQDNAKLVDIAYLEPAFDGVWFHGKYGKWAKIADKEKEQFVSHMRDIHRLKQDNSLLLNKAGIDTANLFTWKNSARTILKHV